MLRMCKYAIVVVIILLATTTSYASLQYRMRDLGTLQGDDAYIYDINSSGRVLGSGYRAYAAIWEPDGTLTHVPELPGALWSDAGAMNDAGTVAGTSAKNSGGWGQAFVWNANSGITAIPILSGYSDNRADDINSAGMVVGYTSNNNVSMTAFKWTATGGTTTLAPLPSHERSDASGLNDLGQVVGRSLKSEPNGSTKRACMWEADGTVVDLGVLSGPSASASAINNAGQVVGSSTFSGTSQSHAFLWTREKGMVDIHSLGSQSLALDINDSGIVVGSYSVPLFNQAFVWSEKTGFATLPGFVGSDYTDARCINDAGLIAGRSRDSAGVFHAVLWEPVPEPSAAIVLLCGLSGLATSLWRRRSA